jgi:peptidoglycan hydrolase CwlO-like protein
MSSSNQQSDKIHALFLSYQDLQTEVRKLQSEVTTKKGKKASKEKELNTIEAMLRESDNELYAEKNVST